MIEEPGVRSDLSLEKKILKGCCVRKLAGPRGAGSAPIAPPTFKAAGSNRLNTVPGSTHGETIVTAILHNEIWMTKN